MTRKAMWGLAAAAVVVLAVYSVTGFPPVGRGTEGTIGAAQKYQAPQINSKDVVLGDASVQEFLQSEAFNQLAKDPDARDLATNASLKYLLANVEFCKELADQNVRLALTSKAVHELYANRDTRIELESQIKATQISSAAVKQATADIRANQAREAVGRVLSNAAIKAGLQKDIVRNTLDDASIRGVMADLKMAQAMNHVAFINAIQQQGFAATLRSGALATQLMK